ncbi:hypothetical protein [Aliamphritea ceti]|uniref:hypothetical protein n=1 Tax=Aliamphritea ceti TaxID=1524258 RepID=UPI0021C42C03|nr:hypothetical protein [Aliamphritea ceti]
MSIEFSAAQNDVLAGLRALPEDLQKDVPVLMVNRIGNTDQAYMRTENFLGYAAPDEVYQLTMEGMITAADMQVQPMPEAVKPPSLELTGDWQSEVDLTIDDANILGGNGRYLLPKGDETLDIPVAETTAEHLAYYNSYLVPVGEALSFKSSGNLPVTVTAVGEDYAEEYLLDPAQGGGAYLEVHDRPHFHMPLDETAGGYLIIGKRNADGKDEVSAFQVPFGYGLHMGPWAIHADAYLVGRYMVIYSATSEFSTVILRKSCGELAKVRFV